MDAPYLLKDLHESLQKRSQGESAKKITLMRSS